MRVFMMVLKDKVFLKAQRLSSNELENTTSHFEKWTPLSKKEPSDQI